ncbi:MAG: glycosyl transferase family 51, partial [Acidobacteria bacterium]|nr:glycosyl transferase family 51 [Acidobacteriota bacterium]
MSAHSTYSENLADTSANRQPDSASAAVPAELKSRRWWIKWLVLLVVIAAAVFYEARTSVLQSRLLPWYAAKLWYQDGDGPSGQIIFPTGGPFDERRGYTRIPDFQQRLQDQGFAVTIQPRFSPELMRLASWGIAPPYREPTVGG